MLCGCCVGVTGVLCGCCVDVVCGWWVGVVCGCCMGVVWVLWQVEDCNSDDGLSSWGVTCTPRDEIIVVDCRNKRMQKFTSNGDLIDHIQVITVLYHHP